MRETLHLDSDIPTNQDSTSSQLSQVEIQESMNTGCKEGITGLANDLIPLGVTFDTLFEIQIKEIDADIAHFNGDSGMKGNLGIAVNENLIPTKTCIAHTNSLITC